MPLSPGARLGPYDLQSRLGGGGMGEVWKAYDAKLQRTVAITVLHDTADAASRILAEASAASALNHPHICTSYDVGDAASSTGAGPAVSFIVMEYVEGKPLSELIPSDGLPPGTVVRYGTQIADALAHAHQHDIVHRDIKSANVVITPDGRAKVLDFGVADKLSPTEAAAVATTHTATAQSGRIVGTLAYMAPEQLRGEAATSHRHEPEAAGRHQGVAGVGRRRCRPARAVSARSRSPGHPSRRLRHHRAAGRRRDEPRVPGRPARRARWQPGEAAPITLVQDWKPPASSRHSECGWPDDVARARVGP